MTDSLRADAVRNIELIVGAAAGAFAEDGTGISMTEVANRAGVGVSTLFRRFPTKSDLIDAVFSASVTRWLSQLSGALHRPSAWSAVRDLIRQVTEEQARQPASANMIVTSFLHGDGFLTERQQTEEAISALLNRAKGAGEIRHDIEWWDVRLVLEANAGVLMAGEEDAAASSRRLVARLLDGFEQPAA
jgi:AcrR family transcriptional regulator